MADDESSRLTSRRVSPDRRAFLRATAGTGVVSSLGLMGINTATAEGGDLIWEFDTGYPVRSSPTVALETVFVGSDDGTLHALDATTGDQRWTFETGSSVERSATVADGTVYVGSRDKNVYAIDGGSGEKQWEFETGDSVQSSPTVTNGTVFIGSDDNNIYALDGATGGQQWMFETGGAVQSSPTEANGAIFVGSDDGAIYSLYAEPGTQRWAFETNRVVNSSPTVADGAVFVGSASGDIYALREISGDLEWSIETGDWVESSPTVADGTVFVGSWDNNVYALDADSGEQQWTFETGKWVTSSPTVADDTVFIGSDDGNVYALDAASGEQQWTFETGDYVQSSPIVVDGVVLVGSDDGTLYALDAGVEGSSRGSRTRLGTLGHGGKNFRVTITNLTTPVRSGDQISVTAEVRNAGPVGGTESVAVEIGANQEQEVVRLSLGDGESTTETISLGAAPEEPGEYPISVSTPSDTATESLHVQAPASFTVEVTDVASPVIAGEELTVRATVTNVGDLEGTQSVEFVAGENITTTTEVTLAGGESTTENISFETTSDDAGLRSLTVRSADDTASESFQIRRPAPFSVSIVDVDSQIVAGEQLTVEAEISNAGEHRATRSIEVTLGEIAQESIEVTLQAGETTMESVQLQTDPGVTGEYSLTVASAEDSATASVAVVADAPESGPPLVGELLRPETILLAGGGSLGTLLGAYGLHRRRRASVFTSTTNSDGESTLGERDSSDDVESTNPHDQELEDTNTAPQSRSERQESTLESEIPVLESLTELDRQDVLLTYRGFHTSAEARVFVHTLVPDASKQHQEGFNRAVSGWYNGHSHPNVVTIHDRGTDPQPWVATEHVGDRRTLEDFPSNDPQDVVSVMTDAAEAIRNVGLYNVSHGNLAPQHIWVEQTEEKPNGIVGDWGLRRSVAEADGETHLTPYTAPEQLSGQTANPSDATDVYGLGVVTYTALTGETPVPADADAIRAGEITPPRERCELPQALDEAVMRALATDPAERFDSAFDFARALNHVL